MNQCRNVEQVKDVLKENASAFASALHRKLSDGYAVLWKKLVGAAKTKIFSTVKSKRGMLYAGYYDFMNHLVPLLEYSMTSVRMIASLLGIFYD
jgi:hypothetical protein